MNDILITPAILAWLLWPAPLEMKPLDPLEWPTGEKVDRVVLPDVAPIPTPRACFPGELCPLADATKPLAPVLPAQPE